MSRTLFYVFLMSVFCDFAVDAQSAANLVIENFYKCKDVPNQKINIIIEPRTFSCPQIMDITLVTPIPLGNQLRLSMNLELYNKFSANNWQNLVTIEDDFCRVLQMYVGPLAYDIEYSMGVPRGACPIPKGHYHAVNYTMDLKMLKLQAIPFGKLRVTVKFVEKSNKNAIACIVFMVANKI